MYTRCTKVMLRWRSYPVRVWLRSRDGAVALCGLRALEFAASGAHEALTRENVSSWAHDRTPSPEHPYSSEQIKQAMCLQAAELR
jgi:hypothetical protein